MNPSSPLQLIKKAEVQIAGEHKEAVLAFKSVMRGVKEVRSKAGKLLNKETVEQQEAREHVEQLETRIVMLRNMRMNWPRFRKKTNFRPNQLTGIGQFVQFLENENYQFESGEGITDDPLLGHFLQPAGAGKTGLGSMLVGLSDVPTLICVPLNPLLAQWKDGLMRFGQVDEKNIGMIGAGQKEYCHKVMIVNYASHRRLMNPKNQKPEALDYRQWVAEECRLFIGDEAHAGMGKATQESIGAMDLNGHEFDDEEGNEITAKEEKDENEVLDNLDKYTAKRSAKIGMTATGRLAKKSIEQHFGRLIGRTYQKEVTDAGITVPYEIHFCDGTIVPGEIGAYIDQEQEIEILDREGTYGKLLGEYSDVMIKYRLEKAKSKSKKEIRLPTRTMAFCTTHAECEKFKEEAEEHHGLKCEILTGYEVRGKGKQEQIDAAFERLRTGEIDMIVTVALLGMGLDKPFVNSVIWARVTSAAQTVQSITRGGRSYYDEELKLWKDRCLVFESDWKLKENGKKGKGAKKKGKKLPMRLVDSFHYQGEETGGVCVDEGGVDVERRRTQEEQAWEEFDQWMEEYEGRKPREGAEDKEEVNWAKWVHNKRAKWRDGTLKQEEIAILKKWKFEPAKKMNAKTAKELDQWMEEHEGRKPKESTEDKEETSWAKWVQKKRAKWKNGTLTREEVAILKKWKFEPAQKQEEITKTAKELDQWMEENGGRPPKGKVEDKEEASWAKWVERKRASWRNGTLTQEEVAILKKWKFEPAKKKGEKREIGKAAKELDQWMEENGGRPPKGKVEDKEEASWANWVQNKRINWRDGTLTREEVAILKKWKFEPAQKQEEITKTAKELDQWMEENGGRPPKGKVEDKEEASWAKWVHKKRAKWRDGTLTQEGIAILKKWKFEPAKKMNAKTAKELDQWMEEHGGRAPKEGAEDKEEASWAKWVHKKRAKWRDGTLKQEEIAVLKKWGFEPPKKKEG